MKLVRAFLTSALVGVLVVLPSHGPDTARPPRSRDDEDSEHRDPPAQWEFARFR
jgi:hypothetical protein